MAKSAIPTINQITDKMIRLNKPAYDIRLFFFDKSRDNLRYHSFDSYVISGSESLATLPIMKGYISTFADAWHLMIRLDELIDKDIADIKEKAQSFVDLDNKLGH